MKSKSFEYKKPGIGKFSTNAREPVALLLKNNIVLGFTNSKFSLIDLINALLEQYGTSNVFINSWTLGIKDIYQLRYLIDVNKIYKVRLLVDNSFSQRNAKYGKEIENIIGNENIRTTRTHAKFVLIENNNTNITITTSMNLCHNPTSEMFTIHQDLEIFEYCKEFIQHHFKNMPLGFNTDNEQSYNTLNSYFGTNIKYWTDEI